MSETYTFMVVSRPNIITTVQFTPPDSNPPDSPDSTPPDPTRVSSRLELSGQPTWIEQHPTRPFVFVSLKGDEGKIAAIKVDNTGSGKLVAATTTRGAKPVHFWVGADRIVVANYEGPRDCELAQVLLNPIGDPWDIFLKTLTITLPPAADGKRQVSQVYQPIFNPESTPESLELLVPDNGTDHICRLSFVKDDDGQWILRHDAPVKGPDDPHPTEISGARHLLVHEGLLYLISETRCELRVYLIAPLEPKGPYSISEPKKPLQTVKRSSTDHTLATEIVIKPPAKPERSSRTEQTWILVSHKDDASELGDPIAIFSVCQGRCKKVGEVRPKLKNLKGMRFSQDGKYLVVGGSDFGGVKVFEWNGKEDEWVKEVGSLPIENPVGFVWLNVDKPV
ncbi:hypothetical protein SISSUDRAFT_1035979 [Sistotremastrum suecicum HHB10207 ss-3]|uniref:WD40 repeat-like protein n=1 Tax=Sistotremastrum suecicum HHB10207 ss-3 TaxID=1314776 RepID=A0A166A1U8_9AGAM|nr:hypothetical protein SISSUDRAFT_1035979 [Sistotremastrum suecicum HHB10207 ss-3]